MIENLNITCAANQSAIVIAKTTSCVLVLHCNLAGNYSDSTDQTGMPGLLLENVTNVRIENLTIAGFRYGVSMVNSTSIEVYNCLIAICHVGILASQVLFSSIANCTLTSDDNAGIMLESSCYSDTLIDNCIVNTSDYGIAIAMSSNNVITITGRECQSWWQIHGYRRRD